MSKIYLLRSTNSNNTYIYKIGITKRSVSKRLKEFKTGNSTTIETIHIFETDKFLFSIEKALHNMYNHLNISGEWFALTDLEVNSFIDNCNKLKANFQILSETSTLNKKFL